MTHVTCRLTAKNRDQLRNPTLGNRVWASFAFFIDKHVGDCGVIVAGAVSSDAGLKSATFQPTKSSGRHCQHLGLQLFGVVLRWSVPCAGRSVRRPAVYCCRYSVRRDCCQYSCKRGGRVIVQYSSTKDITHVITAAKRFSLFPLLISMFFANRDKE